ncbi:hypothetical protein F4680DRAFT_466673 [Xylaria scruposa]|nr:hypothetical protein F4680DRAFT_466673 [Xylaria scruposa]
MPRFMGFFDCFMVRRFLTDDNAGGIQDEQNTAPSVGYVSEPPPSAGHREQMTNTQSQGSSSNDVMEGSDRDNHSRTSASSEASSNNYSRTEHHDDVGRQRHSALEEPDEIELSRPRSAGGAPSASRVEGETIFYRRARWGRSPSNLQPPRRLDQIQMAVIGALFHHPELPHRREIEWRHFKRTMTDLGFSVTSADGASHRFEVSRRSNLFPAGTEGQAITAHRPHGGRTALNISEMRDIGRLLAQAFGWSAETFLRK